jgi:pimeloyl-ACP methyl ester carboxylesterase
MTRAASRSRAQAIRTLILYGHQDWVIPLCAFEGMAALIPGAQLHILEHAGPSVAHDPPELTKHIWLFSSEDLTSSAAISYSISL